MSKSRLAGGEPKAYTVDGSRKDFDPGRDGKPIIVINVATLNYPKTKNKFNKQGRKKNYGNTNFKRHLCH